MLRPPVSSSGRRLLTKLGYALAWAACFGGLLGFSSYLRLPRKDADLEEPWHRSVRRVLEDLELGTYDWRVRALGQSSARSDAVVLVTVDDESLARARQDAEMASWGHTWPRAVWGGLAAQVVQEGGSQVLFDLPLADASPRRERGSPSSDDDQLGRALEQMPRRAVVPFTYSAPPVRAVGSELRPLLVYLGARESPVAARGLLRQIYAARAPAYVIPDGKGVQVWAGAINEAKGRELAERLEITGPRQLRERLAADVDHEVSPAALLVSLAEVKVEGLDPALLPLARAVQPPLPELLTQASSFGFVGSGRRDDEGVLRELPHLVLYQDPRGVPHVLPSATLAAAMQIAGTQQLSYADGVLRIGDRFQLPMDSRGYALLRFDAGESSQIKGTLKRYISAWRLLVNRADLAERQGGVHFPNDLERRPVVLTQTTSDSTNLQRTPVGPMPRSAVLGQALVNLTRSEGIARSSASFDFVLVLAAAVVGALAAVLASATLRSRGGPLPYLTFLAAVVAAHVFVARQLLLVEHRWIPIVAPLLALAATFLAATGYAADVERRVRDFIVATLGASVSPEVARRVGRDLRLIRPERRELTVYRADVVHFSSLVDRLQPDEVLALLNECFTEMSEKVRRTRGHIDKYVGDSLVAFWGAPVPLERHAAAACECALMMSESLEARQADLEARFGQRIAFRVGIGTGSAVVGELGASNHSNYSAVGLPMTLASDLERANKKYGTSLLVSEATRQAAGPGFLFREIDSRIFRTRGPVVRFHELMGRSAAVPEARRKLLSLYGAGLSAYQGRRFHEALELFTLGAARYADAVSRLYASRCRYFIVNPPPLSWDGTHAEEQ